MRFEVAIVGSGPAGASTALHLLARRPALAGRIALIEKQAHPREKYCAGAISAWGLDVLARLGLERLAQGSPIRGLAVRVGAHVGSVKREGLGLVVRRSVFDAALAHAARDAGAALMEHENVRSIARDPGGGFVLTTARGSELWARTVVGADGAAGATRRALGLAEPARRAQLALVESAFPEPRDGVADGTLLFDLGPTTHDGLEGYYWDFAAPLDGPSAGTSRGIFHLNSRPLARPDALRRSLAGKLAARGIDLESVKLKSHSIRRYVPGAPLSVHGALLVGEAAGVDPVTGEGIAHALSMGELAGEAIARALDANDVAFADWTTRVAQGFVGRHLAQACALAPRVYGAHAQALCSFLARTPSALSIAARWYRGERISRAEQLGLLAWLGGDAAARRVSARR